MLSEMLYLKRVTSRLTQLEAADKIGIGLTAYNELERGIYKYKSLKDKTKSGIARFLNVSIRTVEEEYGKEHSNNR